MPAKRYEVYYYGDDGTEKVLRKGTIKTDFLETFDDLVPIYSDFLHARLAGRPVVLSVWRGVVHLFWAGHKVPDDKICSQLKPELDAALDKLL
jgi:hypothetical protein